MDSNNMTSVITLDQLLPYVPLIGGMIALWFRIDASFNKLREDHSEFKILVAHAYAQKSDIGAVEIRVGGQIANNTMTLTNQMNNMTNEIRGLRESVEKVLVLQAEKNA